MPSADEKTERRKIRRGTHSCWECKRRKIRCIFGVAQSSPCDGCRRRGTPCVGQEFPQCSAEPVGDRLSRVEALVQQFARCADSPSSTSINIYRTGEVRTLSTPSTDVAIPAHQIQSPDPENLTVIESVIQLPPNATTNQNQEICNALLAVWPSEGDLTTILSVPVDITICLYGLTCTSYFSNQKAPSTREILQLPVSKSHPVLVAQRLLLLASFLQSIPPGDIHGLERLEASHKDIMARMVETVHTLVNCNDELIASIEGIECIIIESMYHNNEGNLRRSWLTLRRAMLIAQMMGLHKTPSSAKTLEHQTHIRSEQIWFRLVQSDRYLSLLLGLPQGAPDINFNATAKILEHCTPIERLRRIDCFVGGRILQRNESDINNLAATEEIDKLLHTASMSVPPQWWLIPNLASSKNDKMEHFYDMIRMMDQLTHYHLLARLHLPFLLRSSGDRKYEYSKITAMNASRDVLARFVALRGSNPMSASCRGVDFLAFIASATLCLAHIDARHQSRSNFGSIDSGFFSSLIHQRPSDRGMMESSLESMERMASVSPDMVTSKLTIIFQHLLFVEADAANGSNYHTSSSATEDGIECGGELNGGILHINIPYLGTIKIERGSVSSSMPKHNNLDSQSSSYNPRDSFSNPPLPKKQGEHPTNMLDSPAPYSLNDEIGDMEWSSSFLIGIEDWGLQGIDTALFDSLIRGSELDFAEMS